MASTTVTVAIAKSMLLAIQGNMGSRWWKELSTNGDDARRCQERLLEIAGRSVATSSIDSIPGHTAGYTTACLLT